MYDFGYNEDDEEVVADNHFLIMWDELGLDGLVPVDYCKLGDGGDMLAKLEGVQNTYAQEIGRTLFMFKLRAQANSQRHYEIYSLTTTGDITEQFIKDMFESNPQNIVDLIREKGVQVYSNRVSKERPRIV